MPKSSDEIKSEFTAKLAALLKEYNATIDLEADSRGYYSSYDIVINIPRIYEDGPNDRPYCDINCGRCISDDKIAVK